MCGCGGNSPFVYPQQIPQNTVVQPTSCEITIQMLTTWQAMLLCIKNNNLHNNINLTAFQLNQYLGIIQSAINYPDNYCYFYLQLLDIQNNIVPLIVSNVPSCINE